MTTADADWKQCFRRDRDRAILGGVCAGLADYFGFNLKVTRLLAFIAFLMAMPVAVVAYLAVVFLVPSVSRNDIEVVTERRFCRRRTAKPEAGPIEPPKSSIAADISRRCQSLDERLAKLEKHVTSKRFQIEQELSRL